MAERDDRTRRVLRALLPRGRGWRIALLIVAGLVIVALLEPVLGLVAGLLGLLRAVLEPLFATPNGRLLLLNATLLVVFVVLAWSLRQRLRSLRSGLVLRRHLEGMAALLRDDRPRAREALGRVARAPAPAEFEPAAMQARLGLARLALRDDDGEEAVRILSSIGESDMPAELARSLAQLRAKAWLRHGEVLPEEIEQHLRRALDTWPEDVVLLAALRDLRAGAADAEEAIGLQRRIVEHAAPRARTTERHRLVEMLVDGARAKLQGAAVPPARDLCRAWIDEARALVPDDPRPGLVLGELLLACGDTLGAVRAFGRTRSREGLERIATFVDENPDAIGPRELLEACPLDGALLLVARLYARRGQREEAVRAARLAARRCGPTVPVIAGVAEVLARCGREAEADALRIGAVRRALALPPADATEPSRWAPA